MAVQYIDTPAGRMAVLPENEYRRIVEAAEDAEDFAAVAHFQQRLAAREEELVPAAMVTRLIAGESPVKVWREHRGMTARALADAAGLSQAYVSQIEGGKREGSIGALKAIADALGVTIDDLV